METAQAGAQGNSAQNNFDVKHAVDIGSFSGIQKYMYVLAALAMILDGFDGQMIGFAIPAIMKEWGVTRAAFSGAVAAGLVGMAIGSIFAGAAADRIGRRPVLIGSVFLFGACTCLIGYAPDINALAQIRFFAGLGIGAALPTASTLTAEFTPLRFRTVAVTTTIICYPLGGMLAGFFAGAILPAYGWRTFFFIGGALPMIYAVFLLLSLSESPRYLARFSERWEELRNLLSKMTHDVASTLSFSDGQAGEEQAHGSFKELFSPALKIDTLAMWLCFFMTLLSIYSAFSWLPAMLTAEGLQPSMAGMGLTAYNLGGVIGTIICAIAVNYLGSRLPMLVFAVLAVISALSLKSVSITETPQIFLIGLGVHGMFMNGIQCTAYALCAHIYPTHIRVTGTASALAFGRLGAILSSFVGAAMITTGGASAYLNLLGGSMVFTLLALLLVRNHIPASRHAVATAPAAS